MAIFPLFLITVMFGGPIVLAIVGFIKTRSSKDVLASGEAQVVSSSAWPRIINSAVLYALAYNLIFFLQEFFLVLPKAVLNLKPTLFHNNHNWLVSHPAEDLLQGSGALTILIIGLIFVGILAKLRQSTGLFKLFALWMVYQGLTQSLPQLSDMVLNPDGDVGDAMRYLNVGDSLGVILAFLSFVTVVLLGILLTKPLLELSPSTHFVETPGRRTKFIFQIGTLSSVFGFILIVPFRLPPLQQVMGPFLIALFPLLWILANAWRTENVLVIGNVVNEKIAYVPIGILVVLLAIFQLWLAPGVPFF